MLDNTSPDEAPEAPPTPEGVQAGGRRFWLETFAEYSFPPEMVMLVEECARTADVVAWLQDTVDNADTLRPRGSRGQDVAIPELDAPRQYRAQSPPWSSSWICPTTTMRTATTPATSSR